MSLIERSFREKIVLVGVVTQDVSHEVVSESLDELALLVDTAGADVVARVIQKRIHPDPATFIGKGKAEEVRDISYQVDSDTVVFDDELTPAQQRNLEKIFGRTAIDRTAVILDIFGQNARTLEGKAQVELALLKYQLPRLRGRQSSLSQQRGGLGMRMGGGETKLETDRRKILTRIRQLERDLVLATKTRETQRKARQRSNVATVSLVGYTNAGKSTLLNAITQAGTSTENRLFSTLDPIVRKGKLPGGESVLFADTVGFVRKLPHQLVEAFRSTLDEVNDADLLVHVVDASSPDPEVQIAAVHQVLDEIETKRIDELVVFNKIDRVGEYEQQRLQQLIQQYPGCITVSALNSIGIEELVLAIGDRLRALYPIKKYRIPYEKGDLMALLHREAEVIEESSSEEEMLFTVRVEDKISSQLKEYEV